MDIELLMLVGGNDARLEIGPYNGRQRDEGYRLSYVGGQTPTFELARQSNRDSSIIDISKSASRLNDGRVHVNWSFRRLSNFQLHPGGDQRIGVRR